MWLSITHGHLQYKAIYNMWLSTTLLYYVPTSIYFFVNNKNAHVWGRGIMQGCVYTFRGFRNWLESMWEG